MPVAATTRVWSTGEVRGLLWGLTLADVDQIQNGLVRVSLYASGVRYKREPLGSEIWQTARECLELGHGDCEDLAAWLAAERICRDPDALAALKKLYTTVGPIIKDVRPGLRHCLVLDRGTVEDPSKKLGMRGAG